MAALIAGLKGKPRLELLEPVAKKKRRTVSRMMILLRLAVILKHVEAVEALPDLSVSADEGTITLAFPERWGTDHPLTIWEIQQSAPAMEKLGVSVVLNAS